MRKDISFYDRYDVVKVPFPFIDKYSSKKRPALVLASININSHSAVYILSMITSEKGKDYWPMDIQIEDIESTGLPIPSIIRFKIFTLDSRLILGYLGKLSKKDQAKVKHNLKVLL
jgi:mRNA-degrading endonuclease toxin of MazEF toxin-antitoxin module